MSQIYKAVLFDLDGTLLNSAPGVISSLLYTIDKMGLPALPDELLPTFVGPPIKRRLQEVYNISEDAASNAMNIFRKHYGAGDIYKATIYDGLIPTLISLRNKGYQLGVATYKREDQAKSMLEKFELFSYFDVIRGSDVAGNYTKSDIVRMALQDMGCHIPSEAVMIGDSDNDAIGASDIGAHFIGVTYGFGFQNPDDINAFANIGYANSPLEILQFL